MSGLKKANAALVLKQFHKQLIKNYQPNWIAEFIAKIWLEGFISNLRKNEKISPHHRIT